MLTITHKYLSSHETRKHRHIFARVAAFWQRVFQTLPNLDVHPGVAVYHTLKIFSIVNEKDLLMPHTKFQVCTLKINTIFCHRKKKSHYFWTGVYNCVLGKLHVAPCWDLTKHLLQMWLSQRLQNLVGVIMLHNNIVVIIGMTQYISNKFSNTCCLELHKIAGYKSICQCGRFCYKKMMWVQIFKMYISNIYVHIYVCVCVCALWFQKSKAMYLKHFTNSSSIDYEFNWLRPSNISQNIDFLANYGN